MKEKRENVITLIDAFRDFKEEKNIDRPVMMGVLKDVFLTQIAKTFGTADNFDVIINVDKGHRREVRHHAGGVQVDRSCG